MAQTTRYYNNVHIERLDPMFRRPRPGWDVTATVHYYDNPADAAARLTLVVPPSKTPVAGEMISAELREDFREMVTTIIIDLGAQTFAAPANPNRIGQAVTPARRRPPVAWSLRSAVLLTLLHELHHAYQVWSHGERYNDVAVAARQSAAAERARRTLGPGDEPEPYPGYRLNRLETDAEAYAARRIVELKGAIDGGAYDDVLPPGLR